MAVKAAIMAQQVLIKLMQDTIRTQQASINLSKGIVYSLSGDR